MDRSLRFISPLERAFHLKRLGALRDVPPADLGAVALLANEHAFPRGDALCKRGDRVARVHVIVEGRVRVRGREHGEHVLGPDDVLGLLTMLARDEHGLDAVAEADTRTLALSATALYDLLEDHFSLLHNQIRDLAAQTLRLRKRIPDGTYLASAEDLGAAPTGDIDLVQRLLYLRRGVLRDANMDALMGMAQRMRTVHFEPGTTLWRVGAPSGFLYALLSGRVRCTIEDGTHFVCGPGYPLGNLESQCGTARWYEAVTETAVTALENDTDAFVDTLEQHFEMALDFVANMAEGLIARRAEMREEADQQ